VSTYGLTRIEHSADAVRADVAGPATPRTIPVKAWMIIAPVDFIAIATPGVLAPSHLRAFALLGILCLALLHSGGRYRARLHLSVLDDLPTIVGRVFVAVAIVSAITAMRHPRHGVDDFLRWSIASAVLLVLGRCLTNFVILTARKRRLVRHSTVLLGAGPVGVELLRLLEAYPQYGLCVTAVVDDPREGDVLQRGTVRGAAGGALTVCPMDMLDSEVRRVKADVLLVADPAEADEGLLELVRRPGASSCDLLVVPRMHDFHTQSGFVDHIGAIPIMRISSPALLGPARIAKRAFDLAIASFGMIVAAPVMLVAAIAVWAQDGKGVLFRQARITRDGRVFQVLKFRTMRPVDEAESASQWSCAEDARVTRVGRLLRKTSIDELPQLWNILRGDMTLVGPRPERPYFVEQFSAANPRYAQRHRVACGLTGLAQVSGLRGDTSISDRARFDNFYIENWSLWMDVKVLIRTVVEVFGAKGR
jgi:exopolysaccharide biosynthesis polyprenyl glycosylphosphotransferase